jgi:hypothetical protein
MMCDRCDTPITPGEAETIPTHGGSGGGGTVVLHRDRCPVRPPARASYPSGLGAR